MKQSNFNLFFYGLFAKLVMFVGASFIGIGFVIMITASGLIGGGVGLVGLIMLFYGKAQRFDYKQQSGTMIHRGDW